jgi:hypothetical protein
MARSGSWKDCLPARAGSTRRRPARFSNRSGCTCLDAGKREQARYFELRAHLRLSQGDRRGAREDFETSVALCPVKENTAIAPLTDLYQAAGDQAAVSAMQARLKR